MSFLDYSPSEEGRAKLCSCALSRMHRKKLDELLERSALLPKSQIVTFPSGERIGGLSAVVLFYLYYRARQGFLLFRTFLLSLFSRVTVMWRCSSFCKKDARPHQSGISKAISSQTYRHTQGAFVFGRSNLSEISPTQEIGS